MSLPADRDTVPVRPELAIDVARLSGYLEAHVEGYRGPVSVRQFKGGQSNPTYLLDTPEQRYVLRRKPPGQLLTSAHAIDREYRVLEALGGGRTAVPVPRVHALCTDDTVIGTWFYVMEFIEGRIFWDTAFPEIERRQRPEYFDAMNAALASLHGVDPAAVGLGDFGRSSGYLARQIERWSRQYSQDRAAGRIATLERLMEWLSRNVPPEEEAALVHGDFRCDNLIFHPAQSRVIAILDWELSTIGHPLADFAYHVMMYRMPSLAIPGLAGRDLEALNIPSEAEYVAAYCRRTGRDSIPDLDFFIAFCLFRLAGIFHGIRGRLIRGTAVSPRARDYARYVEQIAELGWEQAERAMSHR